MIMADLWCFKMILIGTYISRQIWYVISGMVMSIKATHHQMSAYEEEETGLIAFKK